MKKTTILVDYQQETEHNKQVLMEMLKRASPELFVLFDILEETGINPLILWRTARQLNNIALGGGYGTVMIEIQKGIVTFVRGREDDRIVEPLKFQKTESEK